MTRSAHHSAGLHILLAYCVGLATGCQMTENYLDPDGPRFSGDYVNSEPVLRGDLKVVTYNLFLGKEIDSAIAALSSEPLAGADVVLMQEMDGPGTDRIAEALGWRHVSYPARC